MPEPDDRALAPARPPLAGVLPSDLPVPPIVHDRVMSLIQAQPNPVGDLVVGIDSRASRPRGRRWAGVVAGLAAASVAGIAGMAMIRSAPTPAGSEMAASQASSSAAGAAEAPPAASDAAAEREPAGSASLTFDSGPELTLAVPRLIAAGTGGIAVDPGCLTQLSQLSAVPGQPAVLTHPITYQGLDSLLVVLAKPEGTWDIWVVAPGCNGADPGIRQQLTAPAGQLVTPGQ